MKFFYLLSIIILFLSCKSSAITTLENTLGFNLPNNYIILKDTIEGDIDYVLKVKVKFNNKQDCKSIVNKLKNEYTFKSFKKGYSFELTSNDFNSYNCLIDIDTLNNTLFFKEYHY